MMNQKNSKRIAFLFALTVSGAVTLAACGGGTPAAESPTGTTESNVATEPSSNGDSAGAAAVKFDDMSAPEKMKHMKEVVAPHMAKVFQEAGGYEDFSCVTCHGPGAKQGKFDMPTDAIPALDQEEMDEHPEVTKFMMERVTPEMAKLLGEDVYNPETQAGFGCFGCHTKKE